MDFDYNFDWNPAKEKQNIRKHKLNFRLASTIFRDSYQLTIYDEEHSQNEDRWITEKLRYKASPFMEKKEKKFLLVNPLLYKKR
ncbi:MAG: BrnT family toxin [Okeania sp. SIO2F4]|uniref:BrnT family toxin n=1 Tax=Okeania sp. SIO2F4 TaxID=2607790 RepID=UPI0014298856|nr:BrnT family toxin [Okeania sp. SIO2F4]